MYTTRADKALMGIGLFSALITGMGMPSFVFLFRDLTSGFIDFKDMFDLIATTSKRFLIVGAVMWVTNYIVFAFWGIVSERIAYYYRLNYI